MQRLHVDRGWGCSIAARTEHVGGGFLKLRLPLRDLVRVHVKMLGKLSLCHLAPNRGKRHFRLEGRCVRPACSSAHRLLIRGSNLARHQAETPLTVLCRFPEPALASLNGLRVYLSEGDASPKEILPLKSPRKYWSRRGIAEWLVERLGEKTPTLVAIDHGFSFPLRYFETFGLKLDWPGFLDDFQRDRSIREHGRGKGLVGQRGPKGGDKDRRKIRHPEYLRGRRSDAEVTERGARRFILQHSKVVVRHGQLDLTGP